MKVIQYATCNATQELFPHSSFTGERNGDFMQSTVTDVAMGVSKKDTKSFGCSDGLCLALAMQDRNQHHATVDIAQQQTIGGRSVETRS